MSSNLLQVLRQWIPLGGAVDAAQCVTDRQLLDQFSKERAESAFNHLIQRHGAMVLGVCRRLLRNEQDVEDAFQAVFLVLARRAGDVRWQESIGGWLHETAVRVATHARARDLKRREYETRAIDMRPVTEPPPPFERAELREIFDDEIRQLPKKYQQPLVLCYLEGKSHVEAAAELGWPVGSVKGRLSRAREELRQRLLRRGVTATAAAFAMLLLQDTASAAVPYPLAAATTCGAMAIVTQGGGVVAPGILELVEAALPRPSIRDWLPTGIAGGATIAGAFAILWFLSGVWWNRSAVSKTPDSQHAASDTSPISDPNVAFGGKWSVVSYLNAGEEQEVPQGATAGVNYDRLQILLDEKLLEFEITLDPRQSPPTIDLKTQAEGIKFTQLGVYELRGDELRIVWSSHGEPRPATFDYPEKNGQSRVVLRRFWAGPVSN